MNSSITLTDKNLRFENVGPLMSQQELGEFLGLSDTQLNNFKSRHKIRCVKGTKKYSTAEILEAICGAPEHIGDACADPGIAALRNLSV